MSQACMAISQRAGCRVTALTCAPLPRAQRLAPALCRGLAAHCIAIQCPTLPLVLQMVAVAIQCLYRDQPASYPTLPGVIQSSVLQYKAQSFLPFSHNTTQCIATHLPQQLAASVTIQILYRDTALFTSQGNMLQYSIVYCNTLYPLPT